MKLRDACARYVEDGADINVVSAEITRVAGEDDFAMNLTRVDLVGVCEREEEKEEEDRVYWAEEWMHGLEGM